MTQCYRGCVGRTFVGPTELGITRDPWQGEAGRNHTSLRTNPLMEMWKQPRDRRGLALDRTESRWLSWDLTLGPRKTSPHSLHLSSLSIKGMRELAQGGGCWWSRRGPQSAKPLLRNDTHSLPITGHSFPENDIVLQILPESQGLQGYQTSQS